MDDYLKTIDNIKPLLADYIKSQGLSIKQNNTDITFQCINPAHGDRNPSMFVDVRVPHIAHCRACDASYNIFQCTNILEGKSLYGRSFLEDNVNGLALQFGIDPIDIREMTEDEMHKFNCYQLHLTVADLLKENSSGLVTRTFAQQLQISEEICNKMSIGTILDIDLFVSEVCARGGWSEKELYSLGFDYELFGPTQLTYTIHDKRGRPIAFASRDFRYDGRLGVPLQKQKADSKGILVDIPKWKNTGTTVIYQKSETLYGFHYATSEDHITKVYVVEGYGDAAVMWSYGLKNVVCVGATSFSARHVHMLKEAMINVVIICLDNDEAGWKGTDKVLEEGFSTISHIKPQILLIPPTPREDGKLDIDPDSYIRTYGKEAFEALMPITAFQYTLNRIPDDLTSDDEKALFVERFMPIVMNEPSAITQQQMRKAIANRIDVSEHLIKEEQVNRERIYNHEMRERLKQSFKLTSKKFYEALDLQPEEALSLITEFRDKVNGEMNSSTLARLGTSEVIEGFDAWKEERETGSLEGQCYTTGLTFIDDEWGGIPKRDTFLGILGPPNMGKSALLMNLAGMILTNNQPKTFVLLYWTIDDNKYTLYDKLIACASNRPIYEVNTYSSQPEEVKNKIKPALYALEQCIKTHQCLSVKDRDIGTSADDCRQWVLAMKEKYADRDILLFIDNFANMSGPYKEELQNERYNIEILHELRTRYEVAIISSFELNKEGSEGRFTNKAMRGSQSKLYRLTLALNLYNELGEAMNAGRSTAQDYWIDHLGKKQPIVETVVSKNKLNCKTGFKGKLFWKFVPYIGYMELLGDEVSYRAWKAENQRGKHRQVVSDAISYVEVIPTAASIELAAPKTYDIVDLDPEENKDNGAMILDRV